MSVTRTERNRRRYQPLPHAIALQMTSVVKRLLSIARSWRENEELSAGTAAAVEEVQDVNAQFAELITFVTQDALGIYAEASMSTRSFASEYSTSSYQAYHSPSSVDLLTSNVDAMVVDHHMSAAPLLENTADIVMGDAEATRRLILQIESLLSLKNLKAQDGHTSMKIFNHFNRVVAELAQIAPVLDDIVQAGKNLIVLTDYAGPGWVTVLQDTLPSSDPTSSSAATSSSTTASSSTTVSFSVTASSSATAFASPASLMVLRVFRKLLNFHNEAALETLQRDIALGKKVRLVEACSSCLYFFPCPC